MKKSNKILAGMAFAISLLVIGQYALGADLRFNSDPNQKFLVVDQSDKVKNLYANGSQVMVNANVGKDAVVAGAFVSINGDIADDLIAAGANLSIHGNVGGSARVAGGIINIDSNIHDDLAAAGGNIILSQKGSVGGDLIASGGTVLVLGKVTGNIKMSGGTLYIDGAVQGNVDFVGQKLQLGPHTDIKGNINYTSSTVYSRDDASKVAGTVIYHPSKASGIFGLLAGFSIVAFLIILLATILAALVFVYMFRKTYSEIVEDAAANFWRNVLYGLITILAVPLAIIALSFSIVGLYLAFILLVWLGLLLFIAWIIGATELGLKIQQLINRDKKPQFNYGTVALAIAITTVLRFIPLLGPLLAIILLLAGLGALIKKFKRQRE